VNLEVSTGTFMATDRGVVLGFEPKAVVLWWTRQADDGVAPGNSGGIGFWAGGRACAAAWASVDNAEPTRTIRIADDEVVLGLAETGVALRGRLAATPSGFDIAWKGEDPWLVHYLALGGALSAQVGWLSDKVTTGFEPDLVFVSPVAVARRGEIERGLLAGFGAAASSGQVGTSYASRDGAAHADVGGMQTRDAAVVAVESRHAVEALGRVALSPTGFALGWERTWPEPRFVPYLAIGGVRCAVGTALSPAAPGRRSMRKVGFRPEALLLFSWGLGPRSEPADIGRLCVGAATDDAVGCAGWDDRDVAGSTSATHVCSSRDRVLLVVNTQTGDLHAAAELCSLDRRGFTLAWPVSDGFEREYAFVALASASVPRYRSARNRRVPRYG
jgi:hypothetical protein